jgi:Tfp pilus assembly PilM family ATPase
MAQRGDSVNGIEIKKEHIGIAQFSPSTQTVVNASIIIAPIDEPDAAPGDYSAFKPNLKKLIAGIQAEGQDSVVSLPAEYAVVKKIMLDRNESDVRAAVEWELSQQLIGSLDDYTFDFEPCGSDGTDIRRCLAVAYKNAGVQTIAGLLRASKLAPVVVDLDMFALINVFEANYPDLAPSPALIIHGSDEATTIIVTKNGTYEDCETVSHLSGPLSPDSYADMVRDAIALNFPTAVSVPVVCTGGLFSRQDFGEGVFSRLGNARMLDPFAVVRSSIGISGADLQKCLPYLSVAVGLAIRGPQ